jgi:hypothetical protein
MTSTTENYQLQRELTLSDRTQSPLTVRAVTLALTKQDDELIECRLTFQVNPELYQRIDTEALFNLKSEVRNPLSAGEFMPEPDIKIETTLKPDLLPRLAGHTATIDQAATYILNLSQEQPDNPLLSTENWLALSVKQLQESGETGYRTLWDYISPAALVQAATSDSSEEINDAIVNFFKDWTEANLSEVTQKATSQMFEGMTNFFNELTDVNLDEKVEKFWRNLSTSGQILEEIVSFFTKDDWPYTKIKGEPVLLTAFQGENGKWNCSAKVREEQEQFVFYSVCPVNAPDSKRLAVAEFLTRANSGMIIGNFELDFADGEVRYKTSIDVDGDTLSSALIKRLVYANVTMMDEYLPGIMSVIYGEVEPKDAIAQIESQPE